MCGIQFALLIQLVAAGVVRGLKHHYALTIKPDDLSKVCDWYSYRHRRIQHLRLDVHGPHNHLCRLCTTNQSGCWLLGKTLVPNSALRFWICRNSCMLAGNLSMLKDCTPSSAFFPYWQTQDADGNCWGSACWCLLCLDCESFRKHYHRRKAFWQYCKY